MTKYDIIRFYKGGKKRLIMANVSEATRDKWCNSSKTEEAGKWFDGFTLSHKISYACQNKRALYPSNYTPDDLK